MYTTFFTTKWESPILFGQFSQIAPLYNDELSQLLIEEFGLGSRVRIQDIWQALNIEDQKKALIAVEPKYKDNIEKGLQRSNKNENVLKAIWDKEKNCIVGKSHGFWSVYAAPGNEGVFAMKDRVEECEPKSWVEMLVKICKIVNPQGDSINLVVHDKDFGEIYTKDRMYVFEEKDYEMIEQQELKNRYQLKELNIITFQHWNGMPIPDILNNHHAPKSVHDAVRELLVHGNNK